MGNEQSSSDDEEQQPKRIRRTQVAPERQKMRQQSFNEKMPHRQMDGPHRQMDGPVSVVVQKKKKINPYRVLGIEEGASITEIKMAYKKLSRVHHPDKGGPEELFHIINEAYIKLLNEYDQQHEHEMKMNRDVIAQEYQPHNDGKQMVGMGNKFDLDRFNKTFEQCKISDDPFNRGYGEIMDKTMRRNRDEVVVAHPSTIFVEDQEEEEEGGQLQVYKEPQALNGFGVFYSELGQDEISDFTSKGNMDYRKAFSSKFIDPDKTTYKHHDSIESYRRERDNIDYKLNERDRELLILRDKQNEQKEAERVKRLKQRDQLIEEQYNRFNKLMIQ